MICFTLYLRAMFQVQALGEGGGGLYEFWRGDLTEGFLSYRFRGLYSWRGLFSEFYGILQNNATLSPMKNLLFLFYSIFFILCVTIPNSFSYITKPRLRSLWGSREMNQGLGNVDLDFEISKNVSLMMKNPSLDFLYFHFYGKSV